MRTFCPRSPTPITKQVEHQDGTMRLPPPLPPHLQRRYGRRHDGHSALIERLRASPSSTTVPRASCSALYWIPFAYFWPLSPRPSAMGYPALCRRAGPRNDAGYCARRSRCNGYPTACAYREGRHERAGGGGGEGRSCWVNGSTSKENVIIVVGGDGDAGSRRQ